MKRKEPPVSVKSLSRSNHGAFTTSTETVKMERKGSIKFAFQDTNVLPTNNISNSHSNQTPTSFRSNPTPTSNHTVSSFNNSKYDSQKSDEEGIGSHQTSDVGRSSSVELCSSPYHNQDNGLIGTYDYYTIFTYFYISIISCLNEYIVNYKPYIFVYILYINV